MLIWKKIKDFFQKKEEPKLINAFENAREEIVKMVQEQRSSVGLRELTPKEINQATKEYDNRVNLGLSPGLRTETYGQFLYNYPEMPK